jgi:amidophosphoribosyltransferase
MKEPSLNASSRDLDPQPGAASPSIALGPGVEAEADHARAATDAHRAERLACAELPPDDVQRCAALPPEGPRGGDLELADEKPKEYCGIFGVWDHPESANLTYLGLYALQHRGQEAAGIVSTDGVDVRNHRHLGMVADVFSRADLERIRGTAAIGHVRYSTAGGNALANVQPVLISYKGGKLAVAHNGNLVDALLTRRELEARGSIFQSTMDTEVIVHLVACSRGETLVERIIDALSQVKGAYSLLFLSQDQLIAVRDPHGFRPLVLGRLGVSPVIASETCAFDLINAEYEREIEPGEMVVIDRDGVTSFFPFPSVQPAPCIFEYVYFARPDSRVYGRGVYDLRRRMGMELAGESPVEADLVTPVPDSGVPAALGYAQASGLPFQLGLIRNHYVGRTFIEPQQSIRHFGVKIKLNPVREVLNGQRVIVIDDSLVRGTTSRKIIRMIREAGALEVHLRIAAPPTTGPCYYGINTPTEEELIANNRELDEIRRFIGADSLAYLSLPGLYRAVRGTPGRFCDACFSGNYPLEIDDRALGVKTGSSG